MTTPTPDPVLPESPLLRIEQWLAAEGHALGQDARRQFRTLLDHLRILEEQLLNLPSRAPQVTPDGSPRVAPPVTKPAAPVAPETPPAAAAETPAKPAAASATPTSDSATPKKGA
jgi:hypothetical protein